MRTNCIMAYFGLLIFVRSADKQFIALMDITILAERNKATYLVSSGRLTIKACNSENKKLANS